jgi:hypothetical protein
MTPFKDVPRYVAGIAMIAYGVLAIIFQRNPSMIIPLLYTIALLSFGVVLQESSPSGSWLGIGLCLLSTWSQPFLARAIAPILPASSYAYVIPSLIAFTIFLIGSLILGASMSGGRPFHRSSGVVLALAAASVLFFDSFLYAIALMWIGYQLIPRTPRMSQTPPAQP